MTNYNQSLFEELGETKAGAELLRYMGDRKSEYISKITRADPTDVVSIAKNQGKLEVLDLLIRQLNTK